MFFYLDDEQPIVIEMLTAEQALAIVDRTRAERALAYNSAHAQVLENEIAELEDWIDYLSSEGAHDGEQQAAAEYAETLFMDLRIAAADAAMSVAA